MSAPTSSKLATRPRIIARPLVWESDVRPWTLDVRPREGGEDFRPWTMDFRLKKGAADASESIVQCLLSKV